MQVKTRRKPFKIMSTNLAPEPGHLAINQGKNCARDMQLKRTCGCAILIGMLKNSGLAGTILRGFPLTYELMESAFRLLDPERQTERGSQARPLESAEIAVKNARLAAQKMGVKLDSAHILLSLLTSKLGSKKVAALLSGSGVDPNQVIENTLGALKITREQWMEALPTQ